MSVATAQSTTGRDAFQLRHDPWDREAAAPEGEGRMPPTTQERASTFEMEALPQLDFLYRVALRFVRDRTLAEDLVQETMLKAFRSWHQFQPGTNIRAWLATILRHAFLSEYRRATRRGERAPLELREHLSESPETEADPERAFFDQLVDDEVVAAIDALPLEFREPLILCDVEDLQYAEIAAIMGVPLGTIKSRIFRARRILRRRLYAYAVEQGYVGVRAAPRRPEEQGECHPPSSHSFNRNNPEIDHVSQR